MDQTEFCFGSYDQKDTFAIIFLTILVKNGKPPSQTGNKIPTSEHRRTMVPRGLRKAYVLYGASLGTIRNSVSFKIIRQIVKIIR